uniref:Uncharacterized protein n=1 Tax=Romanomermis culicivorax TaxID=13658 RepID=A0A915KCI8_ROMCU
MSFTSFTRATGDELQPTGDGLWVRVMCFELRVSTETGSQTGIFKFSFSSATTDIRMDEYSVFKIRSSMDKKRRNPKTFSYLDQSTY